jgi:hypothetical protein
VLLVLTSAGKVNYLSQFIPIFISYTPGMRQVLIVVILTCYLLIITDDVNSSNLYYVTMVNYRQELEGQILNNIM